MSKFKIGDEVICITDSNLIKKGVHYIIHSVHNYHTLLTLQTLEGQKIYTPNGDRLGEFYMSRFELVTETKPKVVIKKRVTNKQLKDFHKWLDEI